MTKITSPHPDQNQLAAFGLGKLTSDESHWIEQHLDECESCNDTLLNLRDDTFAGVVRSLGEQQGENQPVQSAQGSDTGATSKVGEQSGASNVAQEASHAATMLVDSGDSSLDIELPEALRDHPRYRVVGLIGRGGMGNVYRAQHRLMNRPVALKVINSQLIQRPKAVERFRREVQAAAQLAHPNIVTAYDAEQAGDLHFLVMEFVEGTDLAAIVDQRGPLPVAEACHYIRQAALGLQHAHERGMVHRDIKPHNLMLANSESRDAAGQVKILDFGLAGFVSESAWQEGLETESGSEPGSPNLTTIGSVMGTPDYMAPEQARDAHTADIRADIYSLGCTLCFLLLGVAPFAAGTVVEKLKAHAEQPPPDLSLLRKDVPAQLAAFVSRMLAKDPNGRPADPRAVADALKPFAAGGGAGRRLAQGIGGAAIQPARWRPSKAILVALALFAAMCTGLLGAVVVVAGSRGWLEIQSEVDDVKVVVTKDGQEVTTIDLKTGSQVRWLPSGKYELQLVGGDNEVTLTGKSFELRRLGKAIATATWKTDSLQSIAADRQTITQDGVASDDGGWKITSTQPRSVRLFEVADPNLKPGRFYYRAKLKSQDLKGRAYLEMWVRFPGMGEFFSKGLDKTISGTNGWSEFEIPFLLERGQEPDLVRLNLTVEGSGTVWIKDIELRGRSQDVKKNEVTD